MSQHFSKVSVPPSVGADVSGLALRHYSTATFRPCSFDKNEAESARQSGRQTPAQVEATFEPGCAVVRRLVHCANVWVWLQCSPPARSWAATGEELAMKSKYPVMLALLTGVGIGAAAVQGLHAQAKPKAYSVTETEVLDAAAQAAYTPLVRTAQSAAGGRNFRTAGGKVVGLEGAAPPKRVAISEWDSLEKAEAFYKSKAWNDLAPQREKAVKTIRRYVVEAAN